MARVEQKAPKLKKPMSKKTKTIIISAVSALVLAALVVGLVFLIKYLNKDNSEKKYDSVFTSESTITYKDFLNKLDDGEKSNIEEENIYVFIYSDDTDTYTLSDSVKKLVEECLEASTSSSDKHLGFYLLNAYSEDNTAILSLSINTNNFTDADKKALFSGKNYGANCPCLVKIEGSKITDVSLTRSNDSDLKEMLGKAKEQFSK